jgi:hypothetical protein
MLTLNEQLLEAEAYIERQKKAIDELISLNLWSARRLHTLYKEFAYNELEKITGQYYERL